MLRLSRELTEALQAVHSDAVLAQTLRPEVGICGQLEITQAAKREYLDAARFLFGTCGTICRIAGTSREPSL